MEVTSPGLRPYSLNSAYSSDLLIVTFTTDGEIVAGYSINMDSADIGMKIGDGSFFVLGNQYVFGGQSWGFKTLYQNVTYDIEAPTYDSYLFKYNPNEGGDCFFSGELNSYNLTKINVFQQLSKQGVFVFSAAKNKGLFKQMDNILAY